MCVCVGGVLPICRGAVSVFYSPSRLSNLYSVCNNLLYSLIIWLICSSLSLPNLHLLFCWVLSISEWIKLVFMALFCAAIRRDFVSCFRFSILSYVQVFSWEISLICCLIYLHNCFSSNFYFLVIVVLFIIWVISAVSGRCNQSFFALFYIAFVSSNRCINTIFNASQSFISFFSGHKLAVDITSGF